VRSFRFVDLESPVEYFNSWLTPVPHFFVRNHMHEPSELDAGTWRLTIGGEVEKPVTLTLSDLSKIETHSVVNTLECAGNGRGLYRPQVPGVQWGKGAVGTARFSGPRMRDVLARAGVKPAGKHVMFRGLDKVLDSEFVGNFMNPGYRLPNQPVKPGEAVKPEDTHPVTALGVKSVIAGPVDGASLKPGRIAVHGAAWAGEAEIAKVEISTDGGATWHAATLGQDHAHYAWRLWSYEWKGAAGDHTILSRATDSQGRTQLATPVWNPSGYLYNAYDQVKIHVS
jgi:DMSO/TMAO reductase YedYZ molybdopterin-dependent catalytic subunit